MKSRQVYITWLLSGVLLQRALFRVGANVINLSKGQDEATETLDYCRFMHSQLPDFLRLTKGHDQSSLIDFPAMHSKMRALPATRDAGIGFGSATLIDADEFEFHEYAAENYIEIKPMIDRGDRQYIILSAVNVLKQNTKFKELYRSAREGHDFIQEGEHVACFQDGVGDNGFFPIFIPYGVLPDRTPEWYEKQKTEYADWELRSRYPRTEAEALATVDVLQFFDEPALASMEMDATQPIECTHDGLIKIYKPPVVGEKYCVFTDPSDGKEDPFHTVVMKASTGEGVVEAHGKVTADFAAKIHDELVREYWNAQNSFEVNASAGGKFQETIKSLDTPNVQPTRHPDGKIKKDSYGWYTTPQHKRNMLWSIEEAVRKREAKSRDKMTIQEMRSMIVPEGKEPQTSGVHDDRVMAWAGVWQVYKYMPMGGQKTVSSNYTLSLRYRG